MMSARALQILLVVAVYAALNTTVAEEAICITLDRQGDTIEDEQLCEAAEAALITLKKLAEEGGDAAEEAIANRIKTITPDVQDADPPKKKDNSFFDSGLAQAINENLMIRQSVSDKNLLSEPARATLTLPDDGDDAYTVDIGMAYQLIEVGEDIVISPTLEYHRNSVEDARVSTTEAGLTLTWFAGDIYANHEYGGSGEASLAALTDFSVKYKLDDEKTTDSFRLEALNSPYWQPLGINVPVRLEDGRIGWWGFDFQWGFDYEENTNGKMQTKDGNTSRVTAKLALHLYPFSETLLRRLELVFGAQMWEEMHQNDFYDDGSDGFSILNATLTYYFDTDQRLSVSGGYTKGDNPVNGKLNQDFFLLSLNFKTDFKL